MNLLALLSLVAAFFNFSSANPAINNPPCYVTLDGVCYDLKEGDIIEPRKKSRVVIPGVIDNPTAKSWTNGLIPYVLDARFSSAQRSHIMAAFAHISENTCVRFVARTSEAQYVSVQYNQNAGCTSTLGKGAPTRANIGDGCFHLGIIVHELMHAMGFHHEQTRPDRDSNVEIKWNNIDTAKRNNFNTEPQGVFFGTPYDFGSVMHYSEFSFSMNNQPTIVAKRPTSSRLGQRNGLSAWDRVEINQLYKCPQPKQFFILGWHNLPDISVMKDRDRAMNFCGKHGGRPGMIKSDAEFALASKVKDELGSRTVIWLGMKRPSAGADFKWDDGTAVTVAQWRSGEPNNVGGKENCALMEKSSTVSTDKWIDVPCVIETRNSVLCESYPSLTYFMLTRANKLTRDMAAEECRKVDARLAMTKNEKEYEAAVQVKLDSGVDSAWIGLMRLSKDQQSWRWDDGEKLSSFTKWSSGEPNNSGNDGSCVHMGQNNQWNDLPCQSSDIRSVICERGRYTS